MKWCYYFKDQVDHHGIKKFHFMLQRFDLIQPTRPNHQVNRLQYWDQWVHNECLNNKPKRGSFLIIGALVLLFTYEDKQGSQQQTLDAKLVLQMQFMQTMRLSSNLYFIWVNHFKWNEPTKNLTTSHIMILGVDTLDSSLTVSPGRKNIKPVSEHSANIQTRLLIMIMSISLSI